MASLPSLIDGFGPEIYYSKTYRKMVEDHLTTLKSMTTILVRPITQDDWADLYKYVGDFYGFLTALGYDRKYHWTILRMNGFRSRFDLSTDLTQLILPDWSYIDKLAQLCKEKK